MEAEGKAFSRHSPCSPSRANTALTGTLPVRPHKLHFCEALSHPEKSQTGSRLRRRDGVAATAEEEEEEVVETRAEAAGAAESVTEKEAAESAAGEEAEVWEEGAKGVALGANTEGEGMMGSEGG